MPIYAYRCETCGHAKDVLQKISDPVLTVCPACGADTFKKQVTAAGFQLKGSGWYVTDFRGDSKAGKPAPDGDAAPESGDATAKGDAAKGDAAKGDGAKGDAAKGDVGAPTSAPPKTDSAPTPAASPAPSAKPPAAPSGGGTPAGGQ